jgi:hypothetical protein
MKRRVGKLVLCLVAGAAVNVAVAWECARRVSPAGGTSEVGADQHCSIWTQRCRTALRVETIRHQGSQDIQLERATDVLGWWIPAAWHTAEWSTRAYKNEWRTVECYGWPLLSMYHQPEHTLLSRAGPALHKGPEWGWQTRLKKTFTRSMGCFGSGVRIEPVVLPLRPIEVGFAINTILYAATLWMILALPFAIRRQRRINRRLCPACAYPMGANPTCTECGAALPHP